MREKVILLLVGGLVMGLVTAGCGGDDDDDGDGEALTKEEFIVQADQICAEGSTASSPVSSEIK